MTLFAASLGLVAVFGCPVFAQSFEAASIRPNTRCDAFGPSRGASMPNQLAPTRQRSRS